MSPFEAIEWCNERHEYYCSLASKFMFSIDRVFLKPSTKYIAKGIRRAGRVHLLEHYCEYNLVYLLSVGLDYEQTIAHEVAHHVSWQLSKKYSYHGEAVLMVLEMIFFCKPETRHSYGYSEKDVLIAKAVLTSLQLKESESAGV